ncbi:recombinase family protein [Enterococcus sp. LJL90]
MNYIYGYARVSTRSQELNRQLDILKKYECNEIMTEKITGTKSSRPALDKLKEVVREGDTVVVESWSRLGRSTKDLINLVEFFSDKKVKVISDKENFDTSTPQGKLMLTVFQAFAEFERELIVDRTKEGLKSARARGRVGGRPRADKSKIDHAITLYDTKKYSNKEITEKTGVSPATLYRYLKNRNEIDN